MSAVNPLPSVPENPPVESSSELGLRVAQTEIESLRKQLHDLREECKENILVSSLNDMKDKYEDMMRDRKRMVCSCIKERYMRLYDQCALIHPNLKTLLSIVQSPHIRTFQPQETGTLLRFFMYQLSQTMAQTPNLRETDVCPCGRTFEDEFADDDDDIRDAVLFLSNDEDDGDDDDDDDDESDRGDHEITTDGDHTESETEWRPDDRDEMDDMDDRENRFRSSRRLDYSY